MENILFPFTLAIPIIAIVGGISVAIVRLLTQARLEELARRERIAAIERGIPPEKLPPLAGPSHEFYPLGDSRLRRAHSLLIGGLILVACGIGIGIMMMTFDSDKSRGVVGLLPMLVGVALLVSSTIVWPRDSGANPPRS